jgi:uncharacterized protein
VTGQAVVLGLGSMFNHSTNDQNVVWERDVRRLVVTYKASRAMSAGEELCISYGSHLWFEDADAAADKEDVGDGSDILSKINIDS